jgi:hypothetical protein
VDHSIRKGFMQRHLDVSLSSICASKPQNEVHKLIREWSNDRDFTWQRLSQLDEGTGVSISR